MSQLLQPSLAYGAPTTERSASSPKRALKINRGGNLDVTQRDNTANPPALRIASDAAPIEEAPSEGASFEVVLQELIGSHRFRLHFATGAVIRLDGSRVVIATETQFQADRMKRQLQSELDAAAQRVFGSAATVEVTLDASPEVSHALRAAELASSNSESTRGAQTDLQAPALSQASRPRPRVAPREESFRRLDDFVVGDANKLAFSAADSFAQNSASAPNLLFFHGECGVGKTHLLQGVCRRWMDAAPASSIRYATAEQFTNEYIAAVRASTLDDFRRRIRKLDLLAIDDVHFFASKSATQTEFLHTIDAIALSGARLALVSDEHPRQIKRFSESLISRFLSGMVVRLDRPDRATRLALVRRLATSRGLALRPCAEERLVSRCAGSVREIEGAMARLVAAAHLDGIEQAITATVADRMLGEAASDALPSAPIRLSRIIDAVVQRLGIPRDELLTQSRHQRATRGRGVVAHLARQLTTSSYPEIARALGRSAHSSVHAGAKLIDELLQRDEPLLVGVSTREAMDQLRHDLVRGG